MSRANDRQEGGDHYKTGDRPQHWDLSVMYNWDPFQYQITKYVMRWKDKHESTEARLVDLKKARHFLDKYIEVHEHYDAVHAREGQLPAEQVVVLPRSQEQVDAEYMAQLYADTLFHKDGFRADGTAGYQCAACRNVIWAKSPIGAVEAHICHGPKPPQSAKNAPA